MFETNLPQFPNINIRKHGSLYNDVRIICFSRGACFYGVWSKRRQTKTATGQKGDTKTATKLAWSKRRQVKTATNQNGDRTKQRQVKTATGTLCG